MISLSLIGSAIFPWIISIFGIGGVASAVHSKAGSTYFEDYRKEQRKLFCLDLID